MNPAHRAGSGPLGFAPARACVPLRIGLAGGGTDLGAYCERYGGAVLNATIERYAHVLIEPAADGRVHFAAHDVGLAECFFPDTSSLGAAALVLHKGVMRRMLHQFGNRPGVVPALRVTSRVEAPAGSGLGSSSALVVALVEAFRRSMDLPLGRHDVARIAVEIERTELGLAGGRQDQYAAAFGGVNFLEFAAGGRVAITKLAVPAGTLRALEASMLLCATGVSRHSAAIIEAQQRGLARDELRAGDGAALDGLHQLKRDAHAMREALMAGQIERMAVILDRSWRAKRQTAPGISTARIEALLDEARAHGALGGKVSGAGGGGYLMLIAPPQRQAGIARALEAMGTVVSPVRLAARGARSWLV